MTSYSGSIIGNAVMRGHFGNLVINLLSSLTIDLADVTDDDNLYEALSSYVQVLSMRLVLMDILFACARPHQLTPRL